MESGSAKLKDNFAQKFMQSELMMHVMSILPMAQRPSSCASCYPGSPIDSTVVEGTSSMYAIRHRRLHRSSSRLFSSSPDSISHAHVPLFSTSWCDLRSWQKYCVLASEMSPSSQMIWAHVDEPATLQAKEVHSMPKNAFIHRTGTMCKAAAIQDFQSVGRLRYAFLILACNSRLACGWDVPR